MVVAVLALFVAMGGTGWAVARNSVGTKQLKKNAVTTVKIKKKAVKRSKLGNKAVGTKQIADNAVTGAKVLESSLGTVPNADKLGGQAASAYEPSSKYTRIGTFSLGNGETRLMAAIGPFSFTAKCLINSGGNDITNILIDTGVDNAAFNGDDTDADFDVGTPEADRDFVEATVATGTPSFDHADDSAAAAPDGTQVFGDVWVGVNTLGEPGRCQFGGIFRTV
jgi:hypothetical protein